MSKYEIIIYWSKEDSAFIAEVPELPGCASDGATYQEAREQTYWWMIGYNEERPHYSLGHMTPAEYMERYAENSSLEVST